MLRLLNNLFNSRNRASVLAKYASVSMKMAWDRSIYGKIKLRPEPSGVAIASFFVFKKLLINVSFDLCMLK